MNEKRGGLLWGNLKYQWASNTKKTLGLTRKTYYFGGISYRIIVSLKKIEKGNELLFFVIWE